jgi:SAM-dependent methyltransferase
LGASSPALAVNAQRRYRRYGGGVYPAVQRRFHQIIRDTRIRPARALEVGGHTGPKSLLRAPELAQAERYCLNLAKKGSVDGITAVQGNANDMGVFEDGMFDLVLSNAMLEHDKYFWLSLAEMRRVLAPGGLLVIGAPGYVHDPEHDEGKATATYRVHYTVDYYRFSDQAFRDVFFEGMEDVTVAAILRPPRIIGHGWNPGAARPCDPAGEVPLRTRARRRLSRAVARRD